MQSSNTNSNTPKNTTKPKEAKDNNEPIMWPSERVAQGGFWHTTPKMQYSKETAELVQLLMKESHMTMLMQKKINYNLRNGEPIDKPEPRKINTSGDPNANAKEIMRRARNAKRKSLDKILASGAYDLPRYRPRPTDRMPSEKAKKILQEAMAGLRLSESQLKPRKVKHRRNDYTPTLEDMINELLEQIDERAEWLAEMEELGEGKKYRDEIRDQIAERLRKVKSIETRIQLQKEGYRIID